MSNTVNIKPKHPDLVLDTTSYKECCPINIIGKLGALLQTSGHIQSCYDLWDKKFDRNDFASCVSIAKEFVNVIED